jgi:Arylsulfatase regulator (Fe-S oxidoreductase)
MSDSYLSFSISPEDIELALSNLPQLVFEVTDACNLKCEYCVFGELYSGFDDRLSRNLSFENAKAVIDYLVDFWEKQTRPTVKPPLSIGFFGGEPLMNFSLIEQVVSYIKGLNLSREITYSITSNCLLLDRYMGFLAENDFYLLCSLDGNKQADAYRVRHDGSPSFDKVFKNLKLLQKTYPSYFEGDRVGFNAVLHNLNNTQDIVAFFKKEFNKIPMISEVSYAGVRDDQKLRYEKIFRNMRDDLCQSGNRAELAKDLDLEDPVQNSLMFYLKNNTGNVFRSYNDLLAERATGRRALTGTCLPFSRKMFVKVDGKIMQCERIHHNFIAGMVQNGEVHLDFNEICDSFNGYLDNLRSSCARCAGSRICYKCLFNIKDIETSHPECDEFLTAAQRKEFENNLLRYLYEHPELYRKFVCETVLQ